jgi:hypothetical protein
MSTSNPSAVPDSILDKTVHPALPASVEDTKPEPIRKEGPSEKLTFRVGKDAEGKVELVPIVKKKRVNHIADKIEHETAAFLPGYLPDKVPWIYDPLASKCRDLKNDWRFIRVDLSTEKWFEPITNPVARGKDAGEVPLVAVFHSSTLPRGQEEVQNIYLDAGKHSKYVRITRAFSAVHRWYVVRVTEPKGSSHILTSQHPTKSFAKTDFVLLATPSGDHVLTQWGDINLISARKSDGNVSVKSVTPSVKTETPPPPKILE